MQMQRLHPGQGVTLRPHRAARLVCRVAAPVPPSYRTAASELDLLKGLSLVVPEQPVPDLKDTAATVSFRLLKKVASGEASQGVKPLQNAIAAARNYSPDPDTTVEKAMANVGALLAEQVTGKVSIEVDPRLAGDAQKIVVKVKSIRNMFQEMRVPYSRLLFRLPATFAGIQAAKELEAAGIETHVDMVYSVAQAAAAGAAGVSLVSPSVGRVRDFFTKNPGMIRDPKGPRQDAGALVPGVDPGLACTTEVYNYLKVHHPKTRVMATGVRSREDALALAGCDFVLVPLKVVEQLRATPTTAGYNDGVHAGASASDSVASEESGVAQRLSPKAAAAAAPEKIGPFASKQDFEAALGPAAQQLLAASLASALADREAFGDLRKSTVGTSTL